MPVSTKYIPTLISIEKIRRFAVTEFVKRCDEFCNHHYVVEYKKKCFSYLHHHTYTLLGHFLRDFATFRCIRTNRSDCYVSYFVHACALGVLQSVSYSLYQPTIYMIRTYKA